MKYVDYLAYFYFEISWITDSFDSMSMYPHPGKSFRLVKYNKI